VVLDRALADPEIGGNVLAGMSCRDEVENLTLACGERRDALDGEGAKGGGIDLSRQSLAPAFMASTTLAGANRVATAMVARVQSLDLSFLMNSIPSVPGVDTSTRRHPRRPG
jgi:hypothetical protein